MTFLSLHLFLLSALSLPFCLMSDEKIFVFWIYCFLGRNVSLAIKIGEVLCLQHFHNKL